MAITTIQQLEYSRVNRSRKLIFDKSSISNAAAFQYHSLWRAGGLPTTGAIPGTTPTVCNSVLTGAPRVNFYDLPGDLYLDNMIYTPANTPTTIEIHDRLAHMGGLNGTLTTAQSITGFDLSTLTGSDITVRIGDSNYSDIQWWLEWYTDTGGTASTFTVNVTYNDGTTGNLTGIALAATRRASFLQPLNYLIPTSDAGKFIRGVNSITLSVSTASAGNFGVTATRYRAATTSATLNNTVEYKWDSVGLPKINNNACLQLIQIASTTSTGVIRLEADIVKG